jgi:hypothetical protein
MNTSAYDLSNGKNPTIGVHDGGGGEELFHGNIDEVRIYNRALSAAEIQQLYSRSAPDASQLLSLTSTGNGSVSSTPSGISCANTCNASFATGSTVALTAKPASDSTFAGWGGACTGSGQCVVTMNAAKEVIARFRPTPFAVLTTGVTAGVITAPIATVANTIYFNSADLGKNGAVFVTAVLPTSILSTGVVTSSKFERPAAASGSNPNSNTLVLAQLTSTGWQQVTNGQLIPYASGVLGDQLAAQSILNSADTSALIGAQFCIGYGTSAAEMTAAGRMQLVATVPDPNAQHASRLSCLVTDSLQVQEGWNLLGNSRNQGVQVAALYSDAAWVTAVWKWDAAQQQWQIHAPGMDAGALQNLISQKGYALLGEIKPGDGYWVQASQAASVMLQPGTPFNLTAADLASGWSLVATGVAATPAVFSASVGSVISLWAWDANQANWYFYAPSLDAQGGSVLTEYISKSNYKDFNSNGKTLGNGVGIWVNRQ